MQTAMKMNISGLTARSTFSGVQLQQRPATAARPRFAVTPRAEGPGSRAQQARDQASDDNPAEQAAKEFEKNVVDPFVQKTQENSGLDSSVFNKTAGSAQQDDVGAFADTMSFAGLVPEVTNGRGAMLGMLAAFGAEAATREPVLVQIQKAPVLVLGSFGLIILASVIPVIRGADLSRKGAGPFTPRAEVWNGRLAMVSFALLLLVETFKAGPGLVP